jgi:DNA polymerase-3 subunit alpha
MTLLPMSKKGYKNLITLSTLSYLEGFYYKPRIDEELLKQYNEDIIATSRCLNGRINRYILKAIEKPEYLQKAYSKAQEYKDIFGDRFYIEVQHNGYPDQEIANKILVQIAKDLNIKLVATSDAHYLTRDQSKFHDQLMCLQMNDKVTNPDRLSADPTNIKMLYMADSNEMVERFRDIPGAVETTMEIAERCNVELDYGNYILPSFEIPSQYKIPHQYLVDLATEGLKQRFDGNIPIDYEGRLKYELNVIYNMDFSVYFLVVADYIGWAKANNILVGPGRGSAAGSVVAWALGITNIDPLKYGLLFERFLNPGRKSMPDIDTDFCQERRDEVIEYVKNKYNINNECHVAQIATFSTFKTKGAIRDFVRVQDKDYSYGDKLAKMVPLPKHGIERSLEEILELEPEFNKLEHKEVIDMVKLSDRMIKNIGVHAAGVVMANCPLTDVTALFVSKHPKKGPVVATQFEINHIEQIGLIKFDFLALRNLTSIQKAIAFIKQTQDIEIDIDQIPLDDKATFDALSNGETVGVFQLEQSTGITELTKRIKPRSIEDIGVINAIYRPGPLGSGDVEPYIKRRHGHEAPAYRIPQLEPILKDTYGVLIYQEQVIRAARELASFTPAEADDLRKAVGKKIHEKMAEQKDKFIKGCIHNGISEEDANNIFHDIEAFASYGFNKSHAIAYSTISYQTAYLRTKYPVEFFCALMCTADKQEQIIRYINYCKSHNIEVLPPDINASNEEFTVVGDAIRFGLTAIKDVGLTAIRKIMQARKHDSFEDIYDFMSRIDRTKVNRKVIEALIEAGAFDSFGHKRASMIATAEDLIKYYKAYSLYQDKVKVYREYEKECIKAISAGRKSPRKRKEPVEPIKIELRDMPEFDEDTLLSMEKDRIGFYITSNPLLKFITNNPQALCDVTTGNIADECYNGGYINMLGLISNLRKTRTKKGLEMAIFTLEDLEGFIEVVVFPKAYNQVKHLLKKDILVRIHGSANIEITEEGDNISKIFLSALEDLSKSNKGSLKVNVLLNSVPINGNIELTADSITALIKDFHGETPLYLYAGDLGIRCGYIDYTQDCKFALTRIPNVRIQETMHDK